MQLKFEGPHETTSHTQIVQRTWIAQAPEADNAFVIVCLKLQDLANMLAGRINFVGDTKPTQGVLEEQTDVYLCSWQFKDAAGAQRARPLVGGYNGGFATYREAVQMCEDVWRNRRNFRKPRPVILVPPSGGKSERILQ